MRPRVPPVGSRAGHPDDHRAGDGAPVGEGPLCAPQGASALHGRGDAEVQRAEKIEGSLVIPQTSS